MDDCLGAFFEYIKIQKTLKHLVLDVSKVQTSETFLELCRLHCEYIHVPMIEVYFS